MTLPPRITCERISRVPADHRWLRFMAFTDWFHHDTADVAFAVLDPTRTRVTVPAATDTDTDRDVLGQSRAGRWLSVIARGGGTARAGRKGERPGPSEGCTAPCRTDPARGGG
ncbi:DUF6183 family protein [Streptomyces sp. NPDC000348]|uniref:DUF6183 family protein n=1 Tax=Streptomyces sp. NPDC000348 TaxID=3364538 RepID=UPI0036CFA8F4